jgi:hypothetical protein
MKKTEIKALVECSKSPKTSNFVEFYKKRLSSNVEDVAQPSTQAKTRLELGRPSARGVETPPSSR